MASTVVLTDSVFINFLTQSFAAGSQLTFVVSITGNVENGQIPDRFSFCILDRTGAEIPTLAGENFDQLLAVDINMPSLVFEVFAADPFRVPISGGPAIVLPVPRVVVDLTPPTVSMTLTPNTLWPPNHELVAISAILQVNDNLDPSPTITLISITSNEADDGLGDGDTRGDIQGAVLGADDRQFLLRAERSAMGTGRVYTVTYRVRDASGNATVVTGQVTVPRSQGG